MNTFLVRKGQSTTRLASWRYYQEICLSDVARMGHRLNHIIVMNSLASKRPYLVLVIEHILRQAFNLFAHDSAIFCKPSLETYGVKE